MKTEKAMGMKRSRVPWASKLRPEMRHTVIADPKGRGQMLLPTPLLVAEEISKISHGALRTPSELRASLARRFGADLACPLMTGIFFNIIAGAAEEQIAAGQAPLAPYWRVVLDDGKLSPKTPCGPERQAEHLRGEGHLIEERRGALKLSDFQRRQPA